VTSGTARRIDEYAKGMFRFEHLHDAWIASCAAYLRHLFGDELQGRTVIDYAFGRGNWSLAFLLVGARRVIAIDASEHNVSRFRAFCGQHNVANIEIICGNILEGGIAVNGDFIWLYGVLQNIPDQPAFLDKLAGLASGADSLFYIYFYNAGSLRQLTVDICRKVITYSTESAFTRDSYLFTRPARMRARDDLTAPYVSFRTASDLALLLRSKGLHVRRQDDDFPTFLSGTVAEDFRPHQFLCGLDATGEIEVQEPVAPYAAEIRVLREISDAVFSLPWTEAERKNLAIGLFNTHFSFLINGIYARTSIVETFQFLMYAVLQQADSRALPPLVERYRELFIAALAGQPPNERAAHVTEGMGGNLLTTHLLTASVRV
jgi:hypothetical protein